MSGREVSAAADYRILGTVEVWISGRNVTLQPRVRALVGVLLTEPGRAVSLDRLVEALWDGEPPARSRQQLHTTVARLRRALRDAGVDDVIHTDGPGYRLAVDDEDIDAGRFRRLVAQASTATAAGRSAEAVGLLQAALDLWRGPALSGTSTTTLAGMGARLDEQRLAAFERLAELRLDLGDGNDQIGDLKSWIAEHPLRERLRERLMTALYRSGRRAEALAEFDDARSLLAEQLGIDPGPGLVALHARILHDDPDLLSPIGTGLPGAGPTRPEATRPAESQPDRSEGTRPGAADREAADAEPAIRSLLPAPTGDFTGRDAELAIMLASMPDATEDPAVLTIDGMAGVGKTALAVQAAHVLGKDYPDAQPFLDLHGHTPGRAPLHPDEALDRLLRAVGVAPERIPADLDARAALWRSETADRRVLVVLDNAADSAQVKPLLPGSAGSLAVVTSRRRLTGLDTARPLSLEVLRPDAAAELFVAVAGARSSGATGAAIVAEVVDLCGYLPLAVRLAAARLRHRPAWNVSDLRDRLLDRRHRLGRLAADDRSVRAAFAVSYEHLPDEPRRMFRLLGLHPGRDIDAWAAAALADVSVDRAEELLEDLLDHNLLLQTTPDRYTFHDLLRHHAREVVTREEPEPERGTAVHRLLDYYLAGADRAASRRSPERTLLPHALEHASALAPMPDDTHAADWFTVEESNLIAAAELAAHRDHHEHSMMLPWVVQDFVANWCRHTAWQSTAHQALTSARILDDRAFVARNVLIIGDLQEGLGDLDSAMSSREAALEIATAAGESAIQAVALGKIGSLHGIQGRMDEAVDHIRRSAELHHAAGNHHGEAIALINLGHAVGSIESTQEELDLLAQAGRIATKFGIRDVTLGVLINSAACHTRLGRYDEAEASLRSARTMIDDHGGNRRALAAVLSSLGRVCHRTGRPAEAVEYLSEALDVTRANGIPEDMAKVLHGLADAEREAGRTEQALEHARASLEISQARGYRVEEARALMASAATLRDLGDVPGARLGWELALVIFDDLGSPSADRARAELETLPTSRQR